MASILITGGAGFIGSHTCLVLLDAGHSLVVLDNFVNSSSESLRRVLKLTKNQAEGRLEVVKGDIRSAESVERAFAAAPAGHPIQAVIHFAGLKAVGESIQQPLRYWDVNLSGTRQLLEVMHAHECRAIVFSSSATIYGIPEQVPISETARVQPINPYGHSKAAVERMLSDLANSGSNWRIACLRYFNPVGAHPSGHIGEDPSGTPSNLFPYVSQVAVGKREKLFVFGGDWPTTDGSGVRDYIHVMDLAEGHEAALDTLLSEDPQLLAVNLGSGQGYSVLEVIEAFERACRRTISYEVVCRRPGDAARSIANPALALRRLGWRTKRSLEEMCIDNWKWQLTNPNGYKKIPTHLS